MKILFVSFNLGATAGINNGIAILSSILKEKNNQVKSIFLCEEMGYGFEVKRIKKDILDYNPDIIGISLMEPQLKYVIDFCNDLRRYYKGFVICGGAYPTMSPENMLSVNGIDAVCVGEGEDAMSELVEILKSNGDYTQIKNLWFKSSDGRIIKNKLRPFKNLNELPVDDKELFNLNKIIDLKNGQLEMLLGRGCQFQCSYCINGTYFKKYKDLCEKSQNIQDYLRIRNVDSIIQEIKGLVLKYPKIKKIAFVDDNFSVYNNFIDDFSKKYKKEIGLPFIININPSTFQFRKVKLLKDAGCTTVRFGVESGSERIKRNILNRPIDNSVVINAITESKKLGLTTSTYNMIGLPTETKEEIFKTLKFNALTMPKFIKIMTFYPFTSTPIHELCVKLDLIDHNKKNELDNYDTFTCLKFSKKYQFFLEKIQVAFNWYINVFLNNKTSSEYRKRINSIEKMTVNEWKKFDFYKADKKISQRFKKKGLVHYSKFINRSLAIRHF